MMAISSGIARDINSFPINVVLMKVDFGAVKKKIMSISLRKATEPSLLPTERHDGTDRAILALRGVRGEVVFEGESLRDFDDAVTMLFADESTRDMFSRGDLERALAEIVDEVERVPDREKPEKADTELRAMGEKLRGQIKQHSFIIPLENFDTKERMVKVGNVRIYKFDLDKEEEWLSSLSQGWGVNDSNDEEKDQIYGFCQGILSHFRNRFVAEVDVLATSDGARDLALRRVRTGLSVLKLFSLWADWADPRYFGILGEVIPRTPRFVLESTPSEGFHGFEFQEASSVFPYELDERHMDFMTKNGFGKLDELLGKTEKNNLDRSLLASISWFAEAFDVCGEKIESREDHKGRDVESPNVADRFLKLVVSLESLLIFNERESKATNLAERCAFLLSDVFSKRKEIKDHVLKVYRLRSEIVHGGNLAVSRREANWLMGLVQAVILRFIIKREEWGLSTIKDFKDWFEARKLS